MTDWAAIDFRKLYMVFATSFERLPFFVRGFGAEVLRRCDRQGRIVKGEQVDDALIDDLAFHLRAHDDEKQFLCQSVRLLLKDGYLVFCGGFLTIRNYAEAQKSTSAERMARIRHSKAGVTNVTSDKCDRSDESDKCDVEEKRREEKRIEEIPPTPLVPEEPTSGLFETSRAKPEERYAKAYAEGVASVTGLQYPPPESQFERGAINRTIKAHSAGKRGTELEAWIREKAAAYCRAKRADAKYESGFCPTKWEKWMRSDGGIEVKRALTPDELFTQANNAAQIAARVANRGGR